MAALAFSLALTIPHSFPWEDRFPLGQSFLLRASCAVLTMMETVLRPRKARDKVLRALTLDPQWWCSEAAGAIIGNPRLREHAVLAYA